MRRTIRARSAVLAAYNAVGQGSSRWIVLLAIEEAIECLGGKAPVPGTTEGDAFDRGTVSEHITDALLHVEHADSPKHSTSAIVCLVRAFEAAGRNGAPA